MTPAGLLLAGTLALAAATTDPRAAQPAGAALSGQALDARTEEVAGLLRCPVCQGLSVADSPATMARNMKLEVREKLAQGYDQEQILAQFEQSYGEFVRLRPPLRGANWVVWLGPVAFLVVGGVVAAWALRGTRRATTAETPVLGRGALPDDPRLAEAVQRVRALAYGWPDGVPPTTESKS